MDIAFDRLESAIDYSVWDILQELVYEGKRESFANLKDLQNVIRDSQLIAVEKAFSSTGKASVGQKPTRT